MPRRTGQLRARWQSPSREPTLEAAVPARFALAQRIARKGIPTSTTLPAKGAARRQLRIACVAAVRTVLSEVGPAGALAVARALTTAATATWYREASAGGHAFARRHLW